MVKKALVGALLFLGLLLAADILAAAGYRVILKNGSWVRASQKPAERDGEVRIRLHDQPGRGEAGPRPGEVNIPGRMRTMKNGLKIFVLRDAIESSSLALKMKDLEIKIVNS